MGMIIAGIKLMFLGMAVVTFFLLLLILVVNISFKLLAAGSAKELAEMEAAELKKRKKIALATEGKVLVAIISAAVAAHRARHEQSET
jgi:sodium pump decarboxylase gamma subunit